MPDATKPTAKSNAAAIVMATVKGKRDVTPDEIKTALGAKTYEATFAATSAAYHTYGADCMVARMVTGSKGRYWAYSDPATCTAEEKAKHAARMKGLARGGKAAAKTRKTKTAKQVKTTKTRKTARKPVGTRAKASVIARVNAA